MSSSRWALLVGVNFYGTSDPIGRPGVSPLYGCVPDVEDVRDFLKATACDITILTSSMPSNPLSTLPLEQPKDRATIKNLESAFSSLATKTKAGDEVYIHFSGHGSKAPQGSGAGSLLVLFDEQYGGAWLPSEKLAYLVRNLVDKDILVTVVLDCCFSGGIKRGEQSDEGIVRYTDYDTRSKGGCPPSDDTSRVPNLSAPVLRGARPASLWTIQSENYTCITASTGEETAKEFSYGTRSHAISHGKLSYHLLRLVQLLRSEGAAISDGLLYENLRAQLHLAGRSQHPMRFGAKKTSFFALSKPGDGSRLTSLVRSNSGQKLLLRQGSAHGVEPDDQYEVFPVHDTEMVLNGTKTGSMIVRVTKVDGLAAEVAAFNTNETTDHIETGWIARPLTRLPTAQRANVQLPPSEAKSALWRDNLRDRKFVDLHVGTTSSIGSLGLFCIHVDSQNLYRVSNSSRPATCDLPKVAKSQKYAKQSVIDMIEQMATYHYFQSISNRLPNPAFLSRFDLEIITSTGSHPDAHGILNLKITEKLKLTIRNRSTRDLYLHVYDFGPNYKIEVIEASNGGEFNVVPGRSPSQTDRKFEIDYDMSVPAGQNDCEEVFKIFITGRPTSFAPMSMPDITESLKLSAAKRGTHDNDISDLFTTLNMTVRGSRDGVLRNDWYTHNIIVRTAV
ncbi:hypothetical protein K431DRAFT_288858 [Polychaeton citri CBS 116435]|uniref:Peptidase C14 caspase domain-containing protein n=1 Tax=Polychaeton citri CBS 116435 TaxID=1314669 RepID=A0A9P4Q265_9PEZI|nr:hypothetical protein K431DRAFT_288858 [Polychaeton citri CBS 116435]